jgi:ATP phosphoribosyltransferase regulatory subunit
MPGLDPGIHSVSSRKFAPVEEWIAGSSPAMTTREERRSGSPGLRSLFERAGARFIEVPVLHPADAFLETAGEDIRRRMFVTEGPAGERLALRPDFTIPVCLEHLKSGAGPARYAYEGLVFRRHDSGAPERLETGYEDIGRTDRIAADAEALALAAAAVSDVADGPLAVRIGDIGLFVALLAALGLPEPWRRRLRRSYGLPKMMAANLDRLTAPRGGEDTRLDAELHTLADTHDRDRLAGLVAQRFAAHGHSEGAGRAPREIADRFLDQRALAEAHIEGEKLAALRAYLDLNAELADAPRALAEFARAHGVNLETGLAEFAERAAAILAEKPAAASLHFEAGFGRPLDYYTGIVFEIRVAGQAAPIAGGGRYDRLMEMLGAARATPAVGFTMRLDLAGGAQ